MRFLLTLLVLAIASCGHDDKKHCEQPYSCPDPGWLDCMPPWPNDNNECVGECHDWIVDHCPDVKFAW
jgi:hypothetical protein